MQQIEQGSGVFDGCTSRLYVLLNAMMSVVRACNNFFRERIKERTGNFISNTEYSAQRIAPRRCYRSSVRTHPAQMGQTVGVPHRPERAPQRQLERAEAETSHWSTKSIACLLACLCYIFNGLYAPCLEHPFLSTGRMFHRKLHQWRTKRSHELCVSICKAADTMF